MTNKRSIILTAISVFSVAGCAHLGWSKPAESEDLQRLRAAGAAMAEAKECTVCHDVRTNKVGPSFTRVANRYRGEADERKRLIEVVQSGTTPATIWHWGSVKMPDDRVRVPVSVPEAEILADYILSLE